MIHALASRLDANAEQTTALMATLIEDDMLQLQREDTALLHLDMEWRRRRQLAQHNLCLHESINKLCQANDAIVAHIASLACARREVATQEAREMHVLARRGTEMTTTHDVDVLLHEFQWLYYQCQRAAATAAATPLPPPWQAISVMNARAIDRLRPLLVATLPLRLNLSLVQRGLPRARLARQSSKLAAELAAALSFVARHPPPATATHDDGRTVKTTITTPLRHDDDASSSMPRPRGALSATFRRSVLSTSYLLRHTRHVNVSCLVGDDDDDDDKGPKDTRECHAPTLVVDCGSAPAEDERRQAGSSSIDVDATDPSEMACPRKVPMATDEVRATTPSHLLTEADDTMSQDRPSSSSCDTTMPVPLADKMDKMQVERTARQTAAPIDTSRPSMETEVSTCVSLETRVLSSVYRPLKGSDDDDDDDSAIPVQWHGKTTMIKLDALTRSPQRGRHMRAVTSCGQWATASLASSSLLRDERSTAATDANEADTMRSKGSANHRRQTTLQHTCAVADLQRRLDAADDTAKDLQRDVAKKTAAIETLGGVARPTTTTMAAAHSASPFKEFQRAVDDLSAAKRGTARLTSTTDTLEQEIVDLTRHMHRLEDVRMLRLSTQHEVLRQERARYVREMDVSDAHALSTTTHVELTVATWLKVRPILPSQLNRSLQRDTRPDVPRVDAKDIAVIKELLVLHLPLQLTKTTPSVMALLSSRRASFGRRHTDSTVETPFTLPATQLPELGKHAKRRRRTHGDSEVAAQLLVYDGDPSKGTRCHFGCRDGKDKSQGAAPTMGDAEAQPTMVTRRATSERIRRVCIHEDDDEEVDAIDADGRVVPASPSSSTYVDDVSNEAESTVVDRSSDSDSDQPRTPRPHYVRRQSDMGSNCRTRRPDNADTLEKTLHPVMRRVGSKLLQETTTPRQSDDDDDSDDNSRRNNRRAHPPRLSPTASPSEMETCMPAVSPPSRKASANELEKIDNSRERRGSHRGSTLGLRYGRVTWHSLDDDDDHVRSSPPMPEPTVETKVTKLYVASFGSVPSLAMAEPFVEVTLTTKITSSAAAESTAARHDVAGDNALDDIILQTTARRNSLTTTPVEHLTATPSRVDSIEIHISAPRPHFESLNLWVLNARGRVTRHGVGPCRQLRLHHMDNISSIRSSGGHRQPPTPLAPTPPPHRLQVMGRVEPRDCLMRFRGGRSSSDMHFKVSPPKGDSTADRRSPKRLLARTISFVRLGSPVCHDRHARTTAVHALDQSTTVLVPLQTSRSPHGSPGDGTRQADGITRRASPPKGSGEINSDGSKYATVADGKVAVRAAYCRHVQDAIVVVVVAERVAAKVWTPSSAGRYTFEM
ncbi:Aste57867_15802 [Aphanomyces stellatus]|uniref:Aste57867_15802 protein n=1 Tax=Aphanomyces stellatus TaxID=120398 RepID=A0A485L509_9STRA|nr:hypothetical protein As57867_015746 [Aphanomyces stellatus]VFT92590.1 Aste57867_15802 [Aphanomyces stellatus]